MKICIEGISYFYFIISLSKRDKSHFSIKATHKSSRRSSTITTVNPILSEFSIEESDKKFKESTWIVDKNKSMSLMKIAMQFLSDRSYQKYLERILDDDRKQSKWNNMETSST